MKRVSIGDHIIYVDRVGRQQNALVTAVWGQYEDGRFVDDRGPTINLLFISLNEAKRDDFGRQMERETSVAHKTNSTAPGFFWALPGEMAE